MTFILDPNIIYLVLVVGLWISVTAVHLPGTGLLELLAVGAIIVAVVLLTQMAVSWLALIFLVLGVLTFIITPFIDQRFLLVGLGGLVMQTIGGLWLFGLNTVSPVIVGLTVVLSLIYYRFALIPTLKTNRSKPQMLDDQPLAGMRGYVQKAIDPVGTVYVNGESWTARLHEDAKIEDPSDNIVPSGEEIFVIDREGLTLFVERIKHKRSEA
jgi:membrane-bound serine protease (ClpP class)